MEEVLERLGFRRPRQDEVGLLEATVFSVQGDAAVFAAANRSQRKALVMGLIPELELYRSLERSARARLGEAERQLEVTESESRRIQAELRSWPASTGPFGMSGCGWRAAPSSARFSIGGTPAQGRGGQASSSIQEVALVDSVAPD